MDIFEKDLSGAMVSPDEPGYDKLISTIFDTMATAAEMNAKGWLTPEEVHEYLRRITGREIDKSTTLLPRFMWITARTSASARDAGYSRAALSSTVAASPSVTVYSLPRK